MRLVFARSEIDRHEFSGGDFAVHRHGKGRADKWARNVGAAFAPRYFLGHTIRDTEVPPTFLFGFADLMFERGDFAFHLAQTDSSRHAARFIEEVNDPAGRAADEDDKETHRANERCHAGSDAA